MGYSVDTDQTAFWSRSALFAYAILSKTLVYEILGYLLYTVQNLWEEILIAGKQTFFFEKGDKNLQLKSET